MTKQEQWRIQINESVGPPFSRDLAATLTTRSSLKVAPITLGTSLADRKKLLSYCYLFTVSNTGLLFYSICFHLSLRHGRPSQQFPSSYFLLWPWTLTCDPDFRTWRTNLPHIWVRDHLVHKLLSGHTDTHTRRTDCYVWTTKVIGKIVHTLKQRWLSGEQNCSAFGAPPSDSLFAPSPPYRNLRSATEMEQLTKSM